MSHVLRILLLLGGGITGVWILYRIRKSKVKVEDAVFWTCLAIVLIILGFFPGFTMWISNTLGFQAPVNCIFLIVIALLLEKIFTLSIKQSQMEEKMEVMAAEIAIRSDAITKIGGNTKVE